MNRRDFLRWAGACGAASLATGRGVLAAQPAVAPGGAPDAAGRGARPNIVFILCDDLGYGDVRCLNPQRGKIATPHIDRLAAGGMVFTDAHSASAVCTPTRYGILTGRYPWRTRLQHGVLQDDSEPLISEGRLTLPALLGRSGYHTACVGKWHLGYRYDRPPVDAGQAPGDDEGEPKGDGADPAGKKSGRKAGKRAGGNAVPVGTKILGGPVARGFDTFFGFHHARSMSLLARDDRVVEHIQPVEMLPRLAARAVAYIGERARQAKAAEADRQPFFLYLPLSSPHTPIVPAPAWKGRSGLGDYGDFVMQTDDVVGQVLTALDEHGLADSTLVLFSSDNGCSPAASVDKLEAQGHYPSAAFRGYKADIWDGGHRVPFIARWTGRVKPGSTCEQLVCLNDLMAACADLLNTTLPPEAAPDSVSFLPALLGRPATNRTPPRDSVVHASIHGKFAVRRGRWKLEFCPGSGGWGKPGDDEARKQSLPDVQLYDLSADVGERKNLQADRPEVVRDLTALLEKIVADGRSTPGPPLKNDVPVDLWKKGAARQAS